MWCEGTVDVASADISAASAWAFSCESPRAVFSRALLSLFDLNRHVITLHFIYLYFR